MSVVVHLSDELGQQLQKAADLEQLTLDELVEAMLGGFETNPDTMSDYRLSDEEVAMVNASIDEANQPGAIWYDDDDFDRRLRKSIAERRFAREKATDRDVAYGYSAD